MGHWVCIQHPTAGEVVEGDMEGGLKAEVISWCCIDWPSFTNVIRLRLRKMQDALKDQATDRYSSTLMADSVLD